MEPITRRLLISSILMMLIYMTGLTHAAPHHAEKRIRKTHDSMGHCVPNTMAGCSRMYGNQTVFPNLLNHDSLQEAGLEFHQFWPLIEIGCSEALEPFLCSMYFPICTVLDDVIPPCRAMCQQAKSGCAPLMMEYGFAWPSSLECDLFPSGGLCVLLPGGAETSTPGYMTTTRRYTTPVRPTTTPSAAAPHVAFSVVSNSVEQRVDDAYIYITTINTNFNTESYGGMDRNEMSFVTPINGIYVFMATSIAEDDGAVPLKLLHNGREVMVTSYMDAGDLGASPMGANEIILTLSRGDTVELKVKGGGFFVSTFQEACVVTFNGYLIN